MTKLIGVYDADATLLGEVSYWLGARFGLRHCSLCDITHSLFREKSQWRECQSRLEHDLHVEIETFHRNDQPDDVRACINGQYPAVVMRGDDGVVSMFMTASEIDACGASPEKFAAEI
ncbi:MAG: hypothetical protein ACO32F_07890, partial [Ilumatobacteraceae bacterium]